MGKHKRKDSEYTWVIDAVFDLFGRIIGVFSMVYDNLRDIHYWALLRGDGAWGMYTASAVSHLSI